MCGFSIACHCTTPSRQNLSRHHHCLGTGTLAPDMTLRAICCIAGTASKQYHNNPDHSAQPQQCLSSVWPIGRLRYANHSATRQPGASGEHHIPQRIHSAGNSLAHRYRRNHQRQQRGRRPISATKIWQVVLASRCTAALPGALCAGRQRRPERTPLRMMPNHAACEWNRHNAAACGHIQRLPVHVPGLHSHQLHQQCHQHLAGLLLHHQRSSSELHCQPGMAAHTALLLHPRPGFSSAQSQPMRGERRMPLRPAS